jgi:hypothetical protein
VIPRGYGFTDRVEQLIDDLLPAAPERLSVRAPVVELVVDEVEGVLAGSPVPKSLRIGTAHGRNRNKTLSL